MVPRIASKRPESLDLKGLLGANAGHQSEAKLEDIRWQSHAIFSSQLSKHRGACGEQHLAVSRESLLGKRTVPFLSTSLLWATNRSKDTRSKIWHLRFVAVVVVVVVPAVILLIETRKHKSSHRCTEVDTALEILCSALGAQRLLPLLHNSFLI